jgi:hypothetical protein
MYIIVITTAAAVGVFLDMLALQEVGRRLGTKRIARDPNDRQAGTGAVEGASLLCLACW